MNSIFLFFSCRSVVLSRTAKLFETLSRQALRQWLSGAIFCGARVMRHFGSDQMKILNIILLAGIIFGCSLFSIFEGHTIF